MCLRVRGAKGLDADEGENLQGAVRDLNVPVGDPLVKTAWVCAGPAERVSIAVGRTKRRP